MAQEEANLLDAGHGVAPGMARGATWRAVLVGAAMCALIGVSTPYATNVMHASYMDLDFSTPAAMFLFFVLVCIVNGAARAVSRRLALTSNSSWSVISSTKAGTAYLQGLTPRR